jgi:hypothetical protein
MFMLQLVPVGILVGSEQALAPVREPDTFAEGAWDKLTKTKGTFQLQIVIAVKDYALG